MAWYKRYKVPFASRSGDQYVVYIYEQTSGSLVTLTGAAEPFVTQEDDDDDVFTPIRTQTGYLRVIDETQDGSLLETLMPSNNTEKLVSLYKGSYVDGVFVDGDLMWQGFMKASAYTQEWDKQLKVVEFPLKSLLGALDDVKIDKTFAGQTKSFAELIYTAFEDELEATPNKICCGTLATVSWSKMMGVMVNCGMFFSEEEVVNEGDSQKVLVGMSYYDVLSEIAKLFGVQFREFGEMLGVMAYDTGGGIPRQITITWSYFENAVNTSRNLDEDYYPNFLGEESILSYFDFKGVDNVAGFVQGGKEAVVRLDVSEKNYDIIELPITTEDTSTVYEITNQGQPVFVRGQVFVQPHDPRVNSIETYTFLEYKISDSDALVYDYVAASNYSNCLNNSVIFRPLYDPLYSRNDHLHTGAFPCRWMYKKDAQSQPMLVNGMFLNQMYFRTDNDGQVVSSTPGSCYKISTSLPVNLTDGYLHINMKCLNFMRGSDNNMLYFGAYNSSVAQNPQTHLACMVKIGNYVWTPGDGWHTSHVRETFYIDFDEEDIISNKTEEMYIDEDEGYFIPIPAGTTMQGDLEFSITTASYCLIQTPGPQTWTWRDAHSRIITDLQIDFLQTIDPMASRRTSNTYRQTILSSGFDSEVAVDLTIGTNNNNVPSDCFVKSDQTTLITSLPYYYGASDTRNMRPEKNLLARLVAQYNQVRRTFTGVVGTTSLNLLKTTFAYLNRRFFGIVKQRNWRDDTEEVKFVEVS